jgi:hypothetical protein
MFDSNQKTVNAKQAVEQSLQWLEVIVVGLNLCPFAAPVLKHDQLRIEVCEHQKEPLLLAAVLRELDFLQQTDESIISTSLLVFSQSMNNFDQYWAFVETANDLLYEAGLEGIIQIASFHPDYCFEGVEAGDVSHYTNRSPYPMLHFIREAQLSRVLEKYPNPELIPENNILRLQQLGKKKLLALLAH